MPSSQQSSSGILSRIRGLFSRTDPEEQRRKWLIERGRIVEGTIIDIKQQGQSVSNKEIDRNIPCTILYRYTTASVTYESAQTLTAAEVSRFGEFRFGMQISVRYDPRRPANSFVE